MTESFKNTPFKSLSNPFKFIFLPWVLVILVIFYWFCFVPPFFAYYIKSSHPNPTGKYVFLLTNLAIFLMIICILVYIWRKSPGEGIVKCNKDECTFRRFEKDLETCDEWIDIPKVAEKKTLLTLDLNDPQEVCIRSHESNDDQRPLSQNLEVALTPRELFFRDLYEKVFETDSTITRDFIERERAYNSLEMSYVARSLYTKTKSSLNNSEKLYQSEPLTRGKDSIVEIELDGDQPVAEFFVANVIQNKSVTSEIFLYVCDESVKSDKLTSTICVHSEEDDVFVE